MNELAALPARQERINGVLIDGGHNVSAAMALEPVIKNETALVAMMKDKDVEGYLSVVAKKCKKIIATQIDSSRSMNAEELAEIAKKYCSDVIAVNNPVLAFKENGITLVCGSFYLAREVRNLL